MGYYQLELLERAAREMNPGETWKFEMGSKEEAHSEYVQLKKEMKKKDFYSSPARKCLDISREGSVLIVRIGKPNPYPTPIILKG